MTTRSRAARSQSKALRDRADQQLHRPAFVRLIADRFSIAAADAKPLPDDHYRSDRRVPYLLRPQASVIMWRRVALQRRRRSLPGTGSLATLGSAGLRVNGR
jgi:hypothetical protein